jgi:hypothetical protein
VVPEQRSKLVVVRASPVAASRAARAIAWLALPWFFAVLFGGAAILAHFERPLGQAPLALRLALIVLAAIPAAMYILGPLLGRSWAFRWLLASPQPEARLDLDGLTLMLPDRKPMRFEWSDITGMHPANDVWRSAYLLGAGGVVLARLPNVLAHPRGRGSLAQEVVDLRPDRYDVAGTSVTGWADRIAVRDPDRPVTPQADPTRRQAIAFAVIVAILGGFGIVIAIVWFAIGASGG